MIPLKSMAAFTGAGIISAMASSHCCITPVVALLAGSSSLAANSAWIGQARPYLIGLSITVLAFAWHLKLNTAKTNDMDCNCETAKKLPFFNQKHCLAS